MLQSFSQSLFTSKFSTNGEIISILAGNILQEKHPRPFKCAFSSAAGGGQTFRSKNEWERHVTLQHMYLTDWDRNNSLCGDRKGYLP
ncbi:hypothetical protein EV426DRAFT_617101 [Tirmania nivea]|nr:hypothetical protein EV426DRAFT_617101 [Tirmania nivea]